MSQDNAVSKIKDVEIAVPSDCSGARWGVRVCDWHPSEEQWSVVLSTVVHEEKERTRISRFHFRIDAVRSLIGLCLIRVWISRQFGVALPKVRLIRSTQNKPQWDIYGLPSLDLNVLSKRVFFNVSHHGDWVVFGAEIGRLIGVDVTTISIPGKDPSVDRFFYDMRQLFTRHEWSIIRGRASVEVQLIQESYIKALGIGMGFDLQRAEFYYLDEVSDPFGAVGLRLFDSPNSAQPPVPQLEWNFHHYLLDAQHIVATALGPLDAARVSDCVVRIGQPVDTHFGVEDCDRARGEVALGGARLLSVDQTLANPRPDANSATAVNVRDTACEVLSVDELLEPLLKAAEK